MFKLELFPFVAKGDISSRSSDEEGLTAASEPGNPFIFSPQTIRLHKDHELFEDGDVLRHMYLQDLFISEAEDKISVSEFACHISGCSAVFGSLDEYEHHYNSLHRHVCCSCRRSLPSARLLDIHIQEWHDSLFTILAQKQDMLAGLEPLSNHTARPAVLFLRCLWRIESQYLCLVEGCGQTFRTSTQRKDHLIKIHKYPADFRFDKNKKEKRTRQVKQQTDIAMEESTAENICEVTNIMPSNETEQEESMELHLPEEEVNCSGDHSAAAQTTAAEPLKPKYSYRVPKTVCFGHGSVRGFRGHRGRRK